MKPVLLAYYDNAPFGVSLLEDKFEVINLWEVTSPAPLIEANRDRVTTILCSMMHDMNADVIKSFPNLKMIATYSVGYDHIDIKAAQECGVKVSNTPDVLNAETADTGMALLLATAKRIVENDKFLRAGKWLEGYLPCGTSLADKTIGIVGLGGIGKKVAKRCEAFEMNVVYHGRSKQDVAYTYYDDLKAMALECDFLMLTCPGGATTQNLINAEILQALGENGMLINIARGSVVDEPALIKALNEGIIKGAGLDVFADEPNVPEALMAMDNVVLLPHIGSATTETRSKMGQLVIDNILAHFDGKELLTEVKI